MAVHDITIRIESDWPRDELETLAHDILLDVSQGYCGDESDWFTFKVHSAAKI